jgi:hypothetical protein
VRVDEVDVVEAEALEGAVDAFDNVLARETDVVDLVVAKCAAPVDLYVIVNDDFVVSWGFLYFTLVEMTRSLRFQPNLLIASPMTISDSPAA